MEARADSRRCRRCRRELRARRARAADRPGERRGLGRGRRQANLRSRAANAVGGRPHSAPAAQGRDPMARAARAAARERSDAHQALPRRHRADAIRAVSRLPANPPHRGRVLADAARSRGRGGSERRRTRVAAASRAPDHEPAGCLVERLEGRLADRERRGEVPRVPATARASSAT